MLQKRPKSAFGMKSRINMLGIATKKKKDKAFVPPMEGPEMGMKVQQEPF